MALKLFLPCVVRVSNQLGLVEFLRLGRFGDHAYRSISTTIFGNFATMITITEYKVCTLKQ